MRKFSVYLFICSLSFLVPSYVVAQDGDDEDFSMYDNLDFADEAAKRYATSKVIGLSPQKLILIGYDMQGPYKLTSGAVNGTPSEIMNTTLTHGLQLAANIPVYSRNSLIVQLGFNYQGTTFATESATYQNSFNQLMSDATHHTFGLNTTVFKPFNEENFLIFQGSMDMNGDYKLTEFQNLKYLKYSAAAIYGWKSSDRLMWGVGLAQTYRIGELNYIPIVLYNWTHPSLKWGAEVLAPARAHLRYTINPRNMLFFGYELQGQSYRLNNGNNVNWNFDNLELRRGEIRIRAVYERQLAGFIWMGVQAGYRIGYNFNVDHVPNGTDFYRGTFGDDPYAFENTIGNPWYLNFTISLVSP